MLKTKISIAILSIFLGLVMGAFVLAESSPTPSPETNIQGPGDADAVVTPENIQASDLGVSEPKLLSDSPFYFLKEWKRGIQSFLTFNSVKKIELRGKIASEKLLELRKLAENGVKPEIIQKATDKYNQEMEKIKNQAEKIKDTAESSPAVNKFLDKFTEQQTLHQQILEKLQDQVPLQVYQKIEEARTKHLEKFEEVMQKLETKKEQIEESVGRVCVELWDPVCGKDGKTYSNKCFARLASVEVDYKGDCEKECQTDADCPQVKCGSTEASNAKCIGIKNKCVDGKCVLEKTATEKTCGEIKAKTNNLLARANYCSEDSDCIASEIYCSKLVNKNADLSNLKKTIADYYEKCNPPVLVCAEPPVSENIKCAAKKCVVKNTTPTCKEYYWFDANNKECGRKQFCGAFMYQSLRTFNTKEECLRAANGQ